MSPRARWHVPPRSPGTQSKAVPGTLQPLSTCKSGTQLRGWPLTPTQQRQLGSQQRHREPQCRHDSRSLKQTHELRVSGKQRRPGLSRRGRGPQGCRHLRPCHTGPREHRFWLVLCRCPWRPRRRCAAPFKGRLCPSAAGTEGTVALPDHPSTCCLTCTLGQVLRGRPCPDQVSDPGSRSGCPGQARPPKQLGREDLASSRQPGV